MAKSSKARSAASKRGQEREASRKKQKPENRGQIQQALAWLIDERIFSRVTLHGNTTWQCSSLACLTLLWVWSTTPQLTEAFVDARSKADKLGQAIAVTTYQGLMKALMSATEEA